MCKPDKRERKKKKKRSLTLKSTLLMLGSFVHNASFFSHPLCSAENVPHHLETSCLSSITRTNMTDMQSRSYLLTGHPIPEIPPVRFVSHLRRATADARRAAPRDRCVRGGRPWRDVTPVVDGSQDTPGMASREKQHCRAGLRGPCLIAPLCFHLTDSFLSRARASIDGRTGAMNDNILGSLDCRRRSKEWGALASSVQMQTVNA